MTTWREVAELGPEPGLCAPCTYLPPEGTTRPRHEGVLPWGYIKTQPGAVLVPPATEDKDEVPPKMGEEEDEMPPKMDGEDPLKEVCLEGLKTRTWPRTLARKRTSSPCEYYES